MNLSTDTKERIKIGFLFVFQSYKIMMGSLLTLFVPQICEFDYEENRVCTIMDNVQKEQLINNISLGFNCISVMLFLICYGVELKRENFLIKHLDINHDFADNHLDKIIPEKPDFSLALVKYNTFYFKFMVVTTVLYSINLIVSSIAIYEHYAGIATITAYISYTALILLKLYNSLSISYMSKKKNRALSAYITEFSSFNVYDKDYLDKTKDTEALNHHEDERSLNPDSTCDMNIVQGESYDIKPLASRCTIPTKLSKQQINNPRLQEINNNLDSDLDNIIKNALEQITDTIDKNTIDKKTIDKKTIDKKTENKIVDSDTIKDKNSGPDEELFKDLKPIKLELE